MCVVGGFVSLLLAIDPISHPDPPLQAMAPLFPDVTFVKVDVDDAGVSISILI